VLRVAGDAAVGKGRERKCPTAEVRRREDGGGERRQEEPFSGTQPRSYGPEILIRLYSIIRQGDQ
jgi:hypothetical protein